MRDNPHIRMLIDWEKIIQASFGNAISDLSNIGGISNTIRVISAEIGDQATPRELVNLLNRILLRHATRIDKLEKLRPIIEELAKEELDGSFYDWYSKFHSMEAYCHPHIEEPLWTGDILISTTPNDSIYDSAIVLTPECDFAQKKPTGIKVILGVKYKNISEYSLCHTF